MAAHYDFSSLDCQIVPRQLTVISSVVAGRCYRAICYLISMLSSVRVEHIADSVLTILSAKEGRSKIAEDA